MYRLSNTLLGYINLLTLLTAVAVIGGALWLARGTCGQFLQTPLVVLGFVVLVASLAGFVGACFNVAWALWVYLLVVLLLIFVLLGVTVFGFALAGGGCGTQVPGRMYKEYRLDDYSGWLKKWITEDRWWQAVRACVVGSKSCSQLAAWTPLDYLHKDLTPIQPLYNDARVLCYGCASCTAGVLEQARRDWRWLSLANVAVVVVLVALYSIGCCAVRNARRDGPDYPYRRKSTWKFDP